MLQCPPMSNLADNKKAHFDYEILEQYDAGIVLSGQEVKSAKMGHASLKGSHVVFNADGASLLNVHISKYPNAGPLPDYDPTQSRRLLLKKREIEYLRGKIQEKGLTVVPLSLYTARHLIKVKIALVRGKHAHDKRDTLKKRDLDREVRRAID